MTTTSPPFSRNVNVTTSVNGDEWSGTVRAGDTLLTLLRRRLNLTGTKRSCESQVCGACTVLIDGCPVSSCSVLAFEVDGKGVTTIEGLCDGDGFGDLQRAFVDAGAVQCGYCTPGQLMSAEALLAEYSAPDLDSIRHWMAGNICRCGCYPMIFAAINAAVEQRNTV